MLLPQQQQQQQQQLQLVSRQQQQQQNKWSLRQVLVGMVAMLVVGAFAGSAATHINHKHHQRNALRSSTGQPPQLSASRSRHLEEASGSSDSPAAVFAMVLHRHGDRSPTVLLPNDPNNDKWPSGKGQLTPLGMSQLATLGQALYARYVTNFSLLSASYVKQLSFPSAECFICESDITTCLTCLFVCLLTCTATIVAICTYDPLIWIEPS